MKKITCLFIIAIMVLNMFPVYVSAEEAAESNKKEEILFRDYEWGTPYDEIKENEITDSMKYGLDYELSDDAILLQNQSIAGYDCTTYYEFDSNKGLTEGVYFVNEEHSNEEQYYKDYMSLVNKLKGIYGETAEENAVWLSDTYKDRPDKYGMAILVGDLKMQYLWRDKNGNTVEVGIRGDNFECSTLIIYTSSEYKKESNTEGL